MIQCLDSVERQRLQTFGFEKRFLVEQCKTAKTQKVDFDTSMLDLRRARRRELQCKELSCGASQKKNNSKDAGDDIDVKKLPPSELMAFVMPTRIDLLREKVKRPIGSVPPQGLRKWITLPLKNSIPYTNAPENTVVYSRGTVGKELKRPVPDFTTHNERILKSSYTALHDPYAKDYFESPQVRKQLIKQGLITRKGDVICTTGDMNKYRDYLYEVTNGNVRNVLELEERHRSSNIKQEKTLKANNVDEQIRRFSDSNRSLRASFMKMKEESDRYMDLQFRQQAEANRNERFLERKEDEQLDRIQRGIERDIKIQQKISKVKERRLEQQRSVLRAYVTKDIAQYLKKENAYFGEDSENNDYEDLDYILAQTFFGIAKYKEEQQILGTLERDRTKKAWKRQKHAEWHQKMFPEWTRKRQAAEARLWGLVRKYAMIWLNKVRARMAKPVDLDHKSAFMGRQGDTDPVDKALKDLQYITGEKDLGDFVFSIYKMRVQVKAKINKAEALEAEMKAKEKEERDAIAKALGTYSSAVDTEEHAVSPEHSPKQRSIDKSAEKEDNTEKVA